MEQLNEEVITRQEAFDRVVRGLAAQGWERSVSERGTCLYRGPEGRKCAAGHLIPDDLYDPAMETWAAARQEVRCALPTVSDGPGFVRDMQVAHDHPEKTLKEDFRDLAASHELTWPADVPE